MSNTVETPPSQLHDMQSAMEDIPRNNAPGSEGHADMASPHSAENCQSPPVRHAGKDTTSKGRKAKSIERRKADQARMKRNIARGDLEKQRKAETLSRQEQPSWADSILTSSPGEGFDRQLDDESFRDHGDEQNGEPSDADADYNKEDTSDDGYEQDLEQPPIEVSPTSDYHYPTNISKTEDVIQQDSQPIDSSAVLHFPSSLSPVAGSSTQDHHHSSSFTRSTSTAKSSIIDNSSDQDAVNGVHHKSSNSLPTAQIPTSPPQTKSPPRRLAPFAPNTETRSNGFPSAGRSTLHHRDVPNHKDDAHKIATKNAQSPAEQDENVVRQQPGSAAHRKPSIPVPMASTQSGSSHDSAYATTRSKPLLDFTSYTKSEPFVFKSTMPGTYPEPIPAKRLKAAPDSKHDEGAFDDNAKSEHLQHQAEDSFLMSLREKLINARDSVAATVSAAWDNPAGLSWQFVKQCSALVASLLKGPAPDAVVSENSVAEKVYVIRQPTNKRTVDGTVKSKPRQTTLHKTQIQPQQRQSPTPDSVRQPDPPRHGSSRLPETPSQKPPKTPVQRVEVISPGELVDSTEVRVPSPAPGGVEKVKEAAMDPTPMPASEPGEVSPPVQPLQAPSTLGFNSDDEASTKAASPPRDYFTGHSIDYEMLPLPKITCVYPRVFKDETTYPMFMSCMRGSTISAHSKLAIYLFLFHGGRSKVYISEASLLEAVVMMNDRVLAFFEPAVHREVVSWVQTEGARYVNFMRIALETSLVQDEAHHLYHVLFSGQPFVLNLTDTTIDRARQIANDTELRDRFPGIVHLFKQHLPLTHLETMMEYDYTVMPEPKDTMMGGVEEVKVAPNVNQASNVGPPSNTSNTNVANNIPSTNAPAQHNAAPAPTSAPKLPAFSGLILPSQNNAASQLNPISTANGVSNPSNTFRQFAPSQTNAPSQPAAASTMSAARNHISFPPPNPNAHAQPGSSQQSATKPGPTMGVPVGQRNRLNPRGPR